MIGLWLWTSLWLCYTVIAGLCLVHLWYRSVSVIDFWHRWPHLPTTCPFTTSRWTVTGRGKLIRSSSPLTGTWCRRKVWWPFCRLLCLSSPRWVYLLARAGERGRVESIMSIQSSLWWTRGVCICWGRGGEGLGKKVSCPFTLPHDEHFTNVHVVGGRGGKEEGMGGKGGGCITGLLTPPCVGPVYYSLYQLGIITVWPSLPI